MEQAAVLIGNHPVGPTCAKRAGLLTLANRKGGLVFPVTRRALPRDDRKTMAMFEGAAA
jgi:hypothetical protein